MGEARSGPSPLEDALANLSPPLRGFFHKVLNGVQGAIQATLIDTLVGEFHEKFNAMWNNPGDRDAAKAVRQCDRTHRETAAKVVNEVLVSQLVLLARAVAGSAKKGGNGDEGVPGGVFTLIESKIAHLEEQISAIEQMVE